LTGLYSGFTATIIKQSSNQGVRFLVYNELKENFHDIWSPLTAFICGGVAGGISVLCNNPVDVIKTKMQGLEKDQYRTFWQSGKSILKNQGFMFFYRGVTPRLVRVCGDAAIQFCVFDILRDKISSSVPFF